MSTESPSSQDAPTLLWLDDERDPIDSRWHGFFPIPKPKIVWVQNFNAFTGWITEHGLPAAVCFDHDLGDNADQTDGLTAAKWLTQYCATHDKALPRWNIQSANPVGKQNISAILRSFERVHPSEKPLD